MITTSLASLYPYRDNLGLALGSGGARGLAHIAFLEVLEELNIRPREIAGASIGALMGALYGSGLSAREIRAEFESLNLLELGKLVDFQLGNLHGLVKGQKLEKRIQLLIGRREFKDLRIPLKVVVTDFWSGEFVVIDQGPVVPAIRASLSIPGIFVPVSLNGRVCIDGGATNPLPYELLAKTCKAVVAIDVNGERAQESAQTKTPTMIEALLSTFQFLQEHLTDRKMAQTRPAVYIKPSVEKIGLLDFHAVAETYRLIEGDVRRFRQLCLPSRSAPKKRAGGRAPRNRRSR